MAEISEASSVTNDIPYDHPYPFIMIYLVVVRKIATFNSREGIIYAIHNKKRGLK